MMRRRRSRSCGVIADACAATRGALATVAPSRSEVATTMRARKWMVMPSDGGRAPALSTLILGLSEIRTRILRFRYMVKPRGVEITGL